MRFSTLVKNTSDHLKSQSPMRQEDSRMQNVTNRVWEAVIQRSVIALNSIFVKEQDKLEKQAALDYLNKEHKKLLPIYREIVNQKRKINKEAERMASSGRVHDSVVFEREELATFDQKESVIRKKIMAVRLSIHHIIDDDVFSNTQINEVYSDYDGVYPIFSRVKTDIELDD